MTPLVMKIAIVTIKWSAIHCSFGSYKNNKQERKKDKTKKIIQNGLYDAHHC